eukprot:SAG11_NODE_1661_length_4497_cov_5.237608_5_plen_83_part_00
MSTVCVDLPLGSCCLHTARCSTSRCVYVTRLQLRRAIADLCVQIGKRASPPSTMARSLAPRAFYYRRRRTAQPLPQDGWPAM